MNSRYVIGVDIGGTNLRIGAVKADGSLSFFERLPSTDVISGDAVCNLAGVLSDYIIRHDLGGRVEGISIGIPGTVSRAKSYIYSVPNLPSLQNMNLGKILRERLDIPVWIDRDVNYLLMYDVRQQNLDPDRNRTILGFYVGTGLGNAIYINGQPYAGRNGVAGELGHIPFYRVDTPCGCGNTGCCESLCSGYHLADLAKESFPGCAIGDIFTFYREDPRLIEYVDTLSLPVASEITLLDPDCVILGGGVLYMKDFPMERFLDCIRLHTRSPYPSENLEFFFAEKSQASGVIGGAFSVFQILDT